jgi:uncharacterized protein YeaO (DUF488 family)
MHRINIKRVYENPSNGDGYRILVDRLWPRGISKEKAGIEVWLRDVAPSNELREWFSHDPVKWEEFVKRYRKELVGSKAFGNLLSLIRKKKKVTLVYSARDTLHNQAAALKSLLEEKP